MSLSSESQMLNIGISTLNKEFHSHHNSIKKEFITLNKEITKASNIHEFDEAIIRLKQIKINLLESHKKQALYLHNISKRFELMEEIKTNSQQGIDFSKGKYTERFICDYMFRKGYEKSAIDLAKKHSILEYLDLDVHRSNLEVEQSLREYKLQICLEWVDSNQKQLGKQQSVLGFELRKQGFIEIVRNQTKTMEDALSYGMKYFRPYYEKHRLEIKTLLATLAFEDPLRCNIEKYSELYDKEKRWGFLLNLFQKETYKLHNMPSDSLLETYIKAGICAIKTPFCNKEEGDSITNCPACAPEFLSISKQLPYSLPTTSHLLCRMNDSVMNQDNPPMLLPNSEVYSYNAMKSMADSNNGEVTCLKTGEVFKFSKAKKVFIF